MTAMNKLHDILPASYHALVAEDCLVEHVRDDSRLVQAGDVFFAIALDHDLRDQHIKSALDKNPAYVFYEKHYACSLSDPRLIAIDNVRQCLGEAAHRCYGRPSEKMQVVAVTGTNGKTSVCHIAAQMASLMGKKVAVLGTAGNGIWPDLSVSSLTTSGVVALHQQLGEFLQQGVELVLMEVSSHALTQQRVADLTLDIAVFTNLSRDHLDYHHTMQEYASQKRKLFHLPMRKTAILNADEHIVQQWLKSWPQDLPYKCYSVLDQEAEYYLQAESQNVLPQQFQIKNDGICYRSQTVLIGYFNLINILTAFALLAELGFSKAALINHCAQLHAVAGRMQLIQSENSPNVVVDYCHTPDALEKALQSLRAFCTKGVLYCIFGCGGDRDQGKRMQMGEIAEKNADKLVITNDNPRTENPDAIADDIMQGIVDKERVVRILDRQQAVSTVMQQASRDDIVLVAGKGHENYQIIGTEKRPFSDEQVVYDILSMG